MDFAVRNKNIFIHSFNTQPCLSVAPLTPKRLRFKGRRKNPNSPGKPSLRGSPAFTIQVLPVTSRVLVTCIKLCNVNILGLQKMETEASGQEAGKDTNQSFSLSDL